MVGWNTLPTIPVPFCWHQRGKGDRRWAWWSLRDLRNGTQSLTVVVLVVVRKSVRCVKEFEGLIVEQTCVGSSAKKSRKSVKIKKCSVFSSSDNFLLPVPSTDQKQQSQKNGDLTLIRISKSPRFSVINLNSLEKESRNAEIQQSIAVSVSGVSLSDDVSRYRRNSSICQDTSLSWIGAGFNRIYPYFKSSVLSIIVFCSPSISIWEW